MFYNILAAITIIATFALGAWILEQDARANAEAWANYIAYLVWLNEKENGKHFES